MTDPISDMLTRIRNASAVRKSEIVLPMSKIKYQIGKILEKENWIAKCEEVKSGDDAGKKKEFKLVLKYRKSGKPAISSLKRISTPGRRVYVGKDELPRVLNGFGMAIISTSKGLMTNKESRKESMGGEVICEIY
ncbi:30S ribosomal protein S8 [Candidatus Falkowbacteria bacterium]|nr:30S ribosomal protein S8 [Candidatus Falkowbacteria bacterium]